jgi:hypothetical protein
MRRSLIHSLLCMICVVYSAIVGSDTEGTDCFKNHSERLVVLCCYNYTDQRRSCELHCLLVNTKYRGWKFIRNIVHVEGEWYRCSQIWVILAVPRRLCVGMPAFSLIIRRSDRVQFKHGDYDSSHCSIYQLGYQVISDATQ